MKKVVYIVNFLHFDGTYLGVIGAYSDPIGAYNAVALHKSTSYPNHTFVVSRAEVE
jgi:hypothetical protein